MNENFINNHLKEEVIKIILEANEAIMKIYLNSEYNIQIKEDNTPVTEADLLAHKIITKGLKKLTPEIKIVSEEDKNSLAFDLKDNKNLYWLLDPLDGTKEFIKRTGEFTCNIALIKNSRPFYGFVSIPTSGHVFHGGKNLGSYKRLNKFKEYAIKCSIPQNPLRVIMSKSHVNKDTLNYINELKIEYETVQAGSSLKFIKIAEGEADLYPRLGLTSEWDTAAAHSILEGAGGAVLQLNGDPVIYNKEDILNPFFIAKGL